MAGSDFTGRGRGPLSTVLCQGTASAVPISQLFLSSRAGFSPRGICFSDLFCGLFGHAGMPFIFSVRCRLLASDAKVKERRFSAALRAHFHHLVIPTEGFSPSGGICAWCHKKTQLPPLSRSQGKRDNRDAGLKARSTRAAGESRRAAFYSRLSGSKAICFSPAALRSQYLRTQASQLLPAAVSRPLKARAAISE